MVHIPSSLLKILLALVVFVFSVAGHPTASDATVLWLLTSYCALSLGTERTYQ